MGEDIFAQLKKEKELRQIAAQALPTALENKDDVTQSIVDIFEVVPPEVETTFKSIQMYSATNANTIKPGNIILNWRKLPEKISDIVLIGAGATSSWLVPFAILRICQLALDLANIPLSRHHAIALHMILKHKDSSHHNIAENEVFTKTNEYLVEKGDHALDKKQFSQVINELVKLQCVELIDGRLRLKEKVNAKY
jgi:hypothetical protein